MARNNRHYTVIVLALIMVFAAGCAGWGTDGPDEGEDPEPDEADADDLEDADGDADDASDTGDETDDTGETEQAEDTETGTESATDADVDDDSEGSTDDTDTAAQPGDEGDADDDGSTDAPPSDTDESDADDTAPPTDDDESPPSDGNGDAPGNGDDGDAGNGDAGNGNDNGDHQDRYDFSMTVPVVDEAGDPVEGYTVLIGPPGETPDEYTTDANGEATIEFWNTDPDDAVQLEATVDGETRQGHGMHGGMTLDPFVVSTAGNGNGDNGDADTHTLTLNVVGEDGTAQEADFVVEDETGERLTGDNFDGPAAFDLESGEYTVTAYTEAFSDTFRLDGSGMEVVDLTEDTEIVFTGYHDGPAEPGETYDLTVEASTAPPAGETFPIQLEYDDQREYMDESGTVTFEDVPPGTYAVDSVDERGDTSETVAVDIEEDTHVELQSPEWVYLDQPENGENGEENDENDDRQFAAVA